jgi:hypothetical protein
MLESHKEKHLELIKNVITRMAQNSFAYKGWMLTILTGVLVLSTQELKDGIHYVSIVPIIGFWGLDAYYLRQERLFRKLYDHVRQSETIDFSMNTSPFNDQVASWWSVLISKTIIWLYAPALALILAINFIG